MAEFPSTRASLLVRLREPQDEEAWREFVELYTPLVFGYGASRACRTPTPRIFRRKCSAPSPLLWQGSNTTRNAGRSAIGCLPSSDGNCPTGGGRGRIAFAVTVIPRAPEILQQNPVPDRAEAEWETEWQRRVFAWACEQVRGDVSDATWQAFWRTAFEGQSGKEVAAELGITVAAVYLARGRVLARLKALVQSAEEP